MISRELWGKIDGTCVYLYRVEREAFSFSVSNYGGILQSVRVKDGRGKIRDVVLGYDTPEEYVASDTCFGAMIGPIADRIRDGRFMINGVAVQLTKNAGKDALHSADLGFHRVIWNSEAVVDGVRLWNTFDYSHLSGCFGKVSVEVVYRICDTAVISIEYKAIPEKCMPLSITNHSYFNLNGARDSCEDHLISVNADCFAVTDDRADPCCTDRTMKTEGTPFELRKPVKIGSAAGRNDFDECRKVGGIDTFFLTNGEGMREHGTLFCAESGIRLRCISDAEGVLVYSGNSIEPHAGKNGVKYGKRWGCCFETEHYPNAVNMEARKDKVLYDRDHIFESRTEFVFETV